MNDEGATHYSGVIENLGLGHRLLNDTFGECALPRVGWQASSFLTDLSNLVIFGSFSSNRLSGVPLCVLSTRTETVAVKSFFLSSGSVFNGMNLICTITPPMFSPECVFLLFIVLDDVVILTGRYITMP